MVVTGLCFPSSNKKGCYIFFYFILEEQILQKLEQILERLRIFNETKLLKMFKFLKTVGLVKIGIQELVPGEPRMLDRETLSQKCPPKVGMFYIVILIF